MKYRHEQQIGEDRAMSGWRGLTLWLVSFPGYIIFLLSWVGVFAGLGVQLAAWFIPPAHHTAPLYKQPDGTGHGVVLGPALTIIASAAVAVILAVIYWLSVQYTMRAIAKLAGFFDASPWLIKLVGLPLGCGIGAITAMLFRPALGLTALGIAGVLSVVGLCSFGLEYAFLSSHKTRK